MSISRGAHQLKRTGKTQDAIAREVGVTRVSVTYWITGKRVPNDAARAKISSLYGVPAEAWDETHTHRQVKPPTERSYGAVLLANLDIPPAQLAESLGVSRVAVTSWNVGNKKPALEHREIMAKSLHIPVDAWDQPANARPPTPPPEESLAKVRGVLGDLPGIQDEILALLKAVREDTESSPLERAKVLASCTSSLAVLSKVTGEFDYGRHLFRLPIWALVQKAIRKALKNFPEAAAELGKELRLLGDEMIVGNVNVTGRM